MKRIKNWIYGLGLTVGFVLFAKLAWSQLLEESSCAPSLSQNSLQGEAQSVSVPPDVAPSPLLSLKRLQGIPCL